MAYTLSDQQTHLSWTVQSQADLLGSRPRVMLKWMEYNWVHICWADSPTDWTHHLSATLSAHLSSTLKALLAHRPKCQAEAHLIVFTDSSPLQKQELQSFFFNILGFVKVTSINFFFHIIGPFGYHASNQKFLMRTVTSFQWYDASKIKSMLLWTDNERTLLITHAVCWGIGLKDVNTATNIELVLSWKESFVPLVWSCVASEHFCFSQRLHKGSNFE